MEARVGQVRGARLDGGPLRAIGEVLHRRRQLATAAGRIVDAEGRLYAHATTTCLVFAACWRRPGRMVGPQAARAAGATP